MDLKNLLSLSSLVLIIGFSIQSHSQTKKSKIMNNTKNEQIGLLVTMTAKPGKEQAVKEFLLGGLSLVNSEPKTESWFAFQIDETSFGIYDTFESEEGLQAHLTGEVAKALLANAGDLLEGFDASKDIKTVDLFASNHKPGNQNNGLLVVMKAQQGKAKAVEEFLQAGKAYVSDEPSTLSWYALKINKNTYAIFDTFSGNSGRDAHLSGKVAEALMENAPKILEDFGTSAIKKIAILASK